MLDQKRVQLPLIKSFGGVPIYRHIISIAVYIFDLNRLNTIDDAQFYNEPNKSVFDDNYSLFQKFREIVGKILQSQITFYFLSQEKAKRRTKPFNVNVSSLEKLYLSYGRNFI